MNPAANMALFLLLVGLAAVLAVGEPLDAVVSEPSEGAARAADNGVKAVESPSREAPSVASGVAGKASSGRTVAKPRKRTRVPSLIPAAVIAVAIVSMLVLVLLAYTRRGLGFLAERF